jgi:hypothetical protein
MSAFRTDRMAARASSDNLMLFCAYTAGRGRFRQHDRFAELPAGSGVLSETRSSWEWVTPTEARSLTLRLSRELLPLRTAEITEVCAQHGPRSPGHADTARLPRRHGPCCAIRGTPGSGCRTSRLRSGSSTSVRSSGRFGGSTG